ncbi:hypothetical protein ACOMHN_059695 [Nucella lapillus]
MKGRIVRITRNSSLQMTNAARTLNMCEMEMWECADKYYKTNSGTCTSCSSNCLNQLCDKASGTCNECPDKYYKLDNGTCTSCSSDCPNQLCDETSGRCRGALTDDEELDSLWDVQEPIYSNDPSYTNTIPLNQLQKTIVDSLKDRKIADEFQFMVGFKAFPVTNARRQDNYYKNRFKSIVPYDRNRVVLERVNDDDASDYINASFIKGYKADKAYIATQAPKPDTQDDFWRMVWQERITDIVMLTNLKEGIKDKCHEYWPAKGESLNTGHVEITGQEEEERAHFVVRTFSVKKLQSPEQRQVRQYHYVKWMDHEVPATTPLVDFWRYVRARAPRTATAPPLLVHCSAGVGRTGTYIALDILIDQSQQQQDISLYSTVDNLRNYRCHLVQNKGQYKFLHEAVLEAYMSGDSRLKTSSFDSAFPAPIRHDKPHPRIDAQYQKLYQMKTDLIQPSHTTVSLEENRQKNRDPHVLPDDKNLVYITAHRKGRNQYINAVYMPDKGCYWPRRKAAPVTCGAYTVTFMSMTSLGDTLNSYTVNMKRKGKSHDLRVLHYEAWTGEVAHNVPDLITLVDTLQTAHKQSSNEPIIVQCIDSAAKSGALCALWDVISRVTCDDDVDVYLAVRHVHTVRPEAISSLAKRIPGHSSSRDLTPGHISIHRTLSPTRQEKPRPLIDKRSDPRAHQYPHDTVTNTPREAPATHRPGI